MTRIVAITGASSGLGAAMAQAFGAAGYRLFLCGRNEERLAIVSGKTPAIAALLPFDLCDEPNTFAEIMRLNDIDTVVNNAAVNPELKWGPHSPAADVGAIIATNTTAAIEVALCAFDHLAVRGGGTIININSVAGLRGSANEPVYAASKFGLRGFSESVKDAWNAKGIRLIDIYAGAINTGMSAGRSDVDSLIDAAELAEFIVHICDTHSFVAREINIQKSPKGSI
jgi:NADP-dependent 3-hydroxy acid dehydrogenase YdfG